LPIITTTCPFRNSEKLGFGTFSKAGVFVFRRDLLALHDPTREAATHRRGWLGIFVLYGARYERAFFDGTISCTFIEPYPELLGSLLGEGDFDRIQVLPHRLQDVDLAVFRELTANGILFIDLTHVSKTGSDVNRAFFDVLPVLAPGVYIYFHDVLYPFEYSNEWVYEGRAWNELYMLRAFPPVQRRIPGRMLQHIPGAIPRGVLRRTHAASSEESRWEHLAAEVLTTGVKILTSGKHGPRSLH